MNQTRGQALDVESSRVFPLLNGRPRRVAIVSDTFEQINGCAHTLRETVRVLRAHGHDAPVIAPENFRTIANPLYPELRLALPRGRHIGDAVREFRPHSIHVATEGPLGMVARRQCIKHGWQFTSSFHTLWPQYLRLFLGLPESLTWKGLVWFHRGASRIMVSTGFMEQTLLGRGLERIARWSRGIDLSLFRPRPKTLPREHWPISMYVGRLSPEKNIEAFLELDIPGTKYVVGDGPRRHALERRFADAVRRGRLVFLGFLRGEALAEAYANAHVFVFPSRTDTFGIVMLEALASGVPVAAYPIGAAPEVIVTSRLGALDENLEGAVRRALALGDPATCRQRALRYSWEAATEDFLRNLVPARVGWSRGTSRLRAVGEARLA